MLIDYRSFYKKLRTMPASYERIKMFTKLSEWEWNDMVQQGREKTS